MCLSKGRGPDDHHNGLYGRAGSLLLSTPGVRKVSRLAQADTYETGRSEVDLRSMKNQDFTLKPVRDFFQQLTGDQLLASLPEDSRTIGG
jgi:hypothetical protein